ncbi:MAG: hypothetical protein ABIH23_32890, partial [bacterium]
MRKVLRIPFVVSLLISSAQSQAASPPAYPPESLPIVIVESHPITEEDRAAFDPMSGVISGVLEDEPSAKGIRIWRPSLRSYVPVPVTVEGNRFRAEGLPAGLYNITPPDCLGSKEILLGPAERIEDVVVRRKEAHVDLLLTFKPVPGSGETDPWIGVTCWQSGAQPQTRAVPFPRKLPLIVSAWRESELELTVSTIRSGGLYKHKIQIDEEALDEIELDIQLEEWPFLTGKVVDDNGTPLPDMTVIVSPPGERFYHRNPDSLLRTGKFD